MNSKGIELFSVSTSPLLLENVLLIFATSILLALAIAGLYILLRKNIGYRPSYAASLVLLAPLAALLMLIIGNSMARALSIGGGIALIRFRTNFDNPKDLVYIFMTFAIGIAAGLGLIGLAVLSAAIFLLLILLVSLAGRSGKNVGASRLRITVPEDMNYYGAFEGTLDKYCKGYILDQVKTTDYGTLCELRYTVNLRDISKQKALIDELREKNGNLNIILTRKNFED